MSWAGSDPDPARAVAGGRRKDRAAARSFRDVSVRYPDTHVGKAGRQPAEPPSLPRHAT